MEAEMVRDSVLAASGLLSPKDRRTERLSAAAARHLGHSVQQREVDDERGRGSVPARALHVHPPVGALPELHDVRCHEPRVLHGPPRAHQHAAAGADHAERRGVFRSRPCARRANADGRRRDRVASSDASAVSVRRPAPEAARAIYAFRLVATRTPKSGEVERSGVVPAAARAVPKRSGQRRHGRSRATQIADVDAAEQAAWTLVANALLNLDEAFTKE